MATYAKSPHGRINGTVGETVSCMYRGIKVLKSSPIRSGKAASTAQVAQRTKFSQVMAFLKPLKKHIAVGFRNATGKLGAFNVAMQYHLDNMVSGAYPNYEMNFDEAMLAQGNLSAGENVTVSDLQSKSMKLSWGIGDIHGEQELLIRQTDLCYVALYSEKKQLSYLFSGKYTRAELSATLTFPGVFAGSILHGYLFFAAARGKEVSTSVYLGALNIPAQ